MYTRRLCLIFRRFSFGSGMHEMRRAQETISHNILHLAGRFLALPFALNGRIGGEKKRENRLIAFENPPTAAVHQNMFTSLTPFIVVHEARTLVLFIKLAEC